MPCSIDAPEACSSGLSPACWFLSSALPDPWSLFALLRRPEGLRARPDSAGSAAGVGVSLRCCNGGISITTSACVDRVGWEALAEGIFVTACPRCGVEWRRRAAAWASWVADVRR
ncbi:cysteine-rich domain-iron-sulfur cluster-binding domain protein, putative [Xanthomonas campestris pv. raphani 756C]|nr:cysteine-rich domain-iron-sulfur cluster-binding domain protein, putative [Xanthomonas campestris pv. raphani 756C]